MLGVGSCSQLWVVRAGSEDTVFIAWINTALRFTVCTFLLHFGTTLETVFPFLLVSQKFVLHWIFSDLWLLMAIRASDKSLLWTAVPSAVPELCSVSGFTGVTPWALSMQGDSVESPKNSELGLPDHSWPFPVDQDPVSSKQGASAGQEQLRGSHAASLQGQDTRDPLCLWELRTLCHWTQKLHFVNWSFEPRDFPGNAPSSWDWNCLCVRRMLHTTLHFSLQYYAHRGTFCLLLLPMVAFQTIPWPVMMQFLMKFIFS